MAPSAGDFLHYIKGQASDASLLLIAVNVVILSSVAILLYCSLCNKRKAYFTSNGKKRERPKSELKRVTELSQSGTRKNNGNANGAIPSGATTNTQSKESAGVAPVRNGQVNGTRGNEENGESPGMRHRELPLPPPMIDLEPDITDPLYDVINDKRNSLNPQTNAQPAIWDENKKQLEKVVQSNGTMAAKTDDDSEALERINPLYQSVPEIKKTAEEQETNHSSESREERVIMKEPDTTDSTEPREERVIMKDLETNTSPEPREVTVIIKEPETTDSPEPREVTVIMKEPETTDSPKPREERITMKEPETNSSTKPSEESVIMKEPETTISPKPREERITMKEPETTISPKPREERIIMKEPEHLSIEVNGVIYAVVNKASIKKRLVDQWALLGQENPSSEPAVIEKRVTQKIQSPEEALQNNPAAQERQAPLSNSVKLNEALKRCRKRSVKKPYAESVIPINIDLQEVPPTLPDSVITSEDQEHPNEDNIDWQIEMED